MADQPDFDLIAREKTRAHYGDTVADNSWDGTSSFFNSRVPGVWSALTELAAKDPNVVLWPNGDNVALNIPSSRSAMGSVDVPCRGHFEFRHHAPGEDVVHNFSAQQVPLFQGIMKKAAAELAKPGERRAGRANVTRHVLAYT